MVILNYHIWYNIKNFTSGEIQYYMFIAENKVYNVGGFILETNVESPYILTVPDGSFIQFSENLSCDNCYDASLFTSKWRINLFIKSK